ncbi:HipA N-terminal domain-containing protein [Niabella aquatica]
MLRKIKNWFNKNQDDLEGYSRIPEEVEATFSLANDEIPVGILSCKNGEWYFKYTEQFKKNSEKYNPIVGFPDIDKVYKSEVLWPFFQVRIPGLKQPQIQEILKKEKISSSNEVELLKRFGRKTISNSYQLVAG